MRHTLRRLALSLAACLAAAASLAAAADPPSWAYPVNPPDFKGRTDDGTPKRVPDSTAGYTVTQLRDLFAAPVWHPEDHPALPPIVAQGRKPAVFACGVCHRADGPGGPENANIAGLPLAYIVQQMADYKSGARSTALPNRAPQKNMIALAKAITDDEVQAAAQYFAGLKPRPNVRVVESADVPATIVGGWFLADAKTGAREPIGQRVIEMPENTEQFENRDTHSRFVAYVPPGSIARGEALAAGIAGKTDRCAICHGPDLKGLAGIPPIVGRSPSYAIRQLYEFQTGARNGAAAALMKPVVANLTIDDMVALAAYLSSQAP
ncbi:MAG: c-type cytochrome [Vicinamibacteraceae bacterium]